MNEEKRVPNVTSIEHRERDGKSYIVINGTDWFPAERYTEEKAVEDYKVGILLDRVLPKYAPAGGASK